MPRPILAKAHIHTAIREKVANHHIETIRTVQAAIIAHPVVVVGMTINPYCRKARQALQVAGVPHQYLEFGGYFSQWRKRSALKMWSGWPTLPMVFVRGDLVGGYDDLARLIASGELRQLLLPSPALT
jgi:monothiol glutaredoxin